MAKVPFQRELEDLFRSDKTVILKLLGGAAVGVFFSLRIVLKDSRGGGGPTMSTTMKGVVLTGGAIAGALAVLVLLLRDVVGRRVDQGKPVNPILKAYFGKGNGCLMIALWSVTVIFLAFVVTMLTLGL